MLPYKGVFENKRAYYKGKKSKPVWKEKPFQIVFFPYRHDLHVLTERQKPCNLN